MLGGFYAPCLAALAHRPPDAWTAGRLTARTRRLVASDRDRHTGSVRARSAATPGQQPRTRRPGDAHANAGRTVRLSRAVERDARLRQQRSTTLKAVDVLPRGPSFKGMVCHLVTAAEPAGAMADAHARASRAARHPVNPSPRRRSRVRTGGPLAPSGQHPVNPIAHPRAILAHGVDLSRERSLRFRLCRRHVDHAPHLAFPADPPQEQREQLAHVQPVRLRPPRPTVHFDARRLHHHVLRALRRQPPVQPEAIPPGLVTALHRCVARQACFLSSFSPNTASPPFYTPDRPPF